ncbi:dienelactone hydrolase family protein [Rhodococcoides kyotonense]|uniref:Carboxymethylenebutenolidase n=1 Tax=Rhodococcoides kyotonense TaxID=398843 RepID=A0A239FRS2_9NOCA|nr:dienelactone hydrolase family protein [Rhodococcus kyotonensis]SNS59657.1 carboxymethylenebutenolidase [Rhodococcus kyotonensis]
MSGIFTDVAVLRVDAEVEGDEPPQSTEAPQKVPLTAIAPEGSVRGGIVVLHESREIPESLIDLLRALALEGWLAVAPDLFHRDGVDGEVFGDNLFADFDATFDWLTSRGVYPDCVGVIGFDDAGTAALIVATNRRIGAAVSVAAAGIVEPLNADAVALIEAAPSLQAPWLGLYGENDPKTPPEHIDTLREAATRASVATNIVSYSGLRHRADAVQAPPGSAEDTDPAADALIEAQARIFDWFDSFLR